MLNRSLFWPVGLGILILVAFAPTVRAGELVTYAEEVGVLNSGAGVYWTGEIFNHPNEGDDFEVGLLDEDVPFFTDRTHEYNGVDDVYTLEEVGLVGAEIVMFPNDNKDVQGYEVEITLAQTVDAYFFEDQRHAVVPPWLEENGWVWTGHEIGIDEGGDGVGPGQGINQRFWVWKKADVPAGILTTYDPMSPGQNMYGVAFMLPGTGPDMREDLPTEWPGSDFKPGNFGLIDIGATGGRPDFGAMQDTDGVAQIGADVHNTNGLDLDVRDMVSNLGDNFSITIDNLDEDEVFVGGLDWRDRGNNRFADAFDLPLIQLGEDLVKNNQGIIRVTLSDLPAGPYEVTSYHLDPGYTQCEAINILVDVGDGNGFVDTGVLGNAALINTPVGSLTPEMMLDAGATFNFEADGIHDVMILFDGRFAIDTEVPLNGLNIKFGTVTLPGDFNGNGELDLEDIDILTAQSAAGTNLPQYDLTGDDLVDGEDVKLWAKSKDIGYTWIGDANFDGQFNTGDFVQVLGAGKYEDLNATAVWSEGDWNGDGAFDTGDLVAALSDGGYEIGPRTDVAAVPEPGSLLLLLLGLIGLAARRR